MATSADVAMVAIRRPTGIFSGAGDGAGAGAAGAMAAGAMADGARADGTAPSGSPGVGWSAVGAVAAAAADGAAADGEAADGAACGQGAGAAGRRGGAGFGAASLLAGGRLECAPLCQVRARITWVGVSLTFSGRLEALVSRSSSCCAVGRLCGSLAREASTSGRSDSGTEAMSA